MKPDEQHPEKIDNEIKSLYKKARELLKKPEYRQDMDIILSESRGFLSRVKEDEHLKRLGIDVQNLRKEIMCNEKGQIDFGTIRNSLPAFKNVLVPALTQALKTIPVTPIHSDDEKYTIDITNLALSADELLPENANIHFANDLFFDFSGHGNDHFDSALSLSMNEFTTTLKDLNFHYERKKMPRMSDAGVADISIRGTSIKMKWRMEKIEDRISFNVEKVKCTMRELNTTVKEAQHKILDRLALKLFNTQIKRSIELAVEKALRERLEKFSINTTTSEISASFKSSMPSFKKKNSKEEIKKALPSAEESSKISEESKIKTEVKEKVHEPVTTEKSTPSSSTEETAKTSPRSSATEEIKEESKHHHHHHHHHHKESKKPTEETAKKATSPQSSTDDIKNKVQEPMKTEVEGSKKKDAPSTTTSDSAVVHQG